MTEPSKQSGSDPVGDLQRWLVRSGARSVTRQLSGQIRTALGGGKQSSADVWETATSDYDESPECAWCPICRARRRLRESGPGLGAGVAAAADAVGVVMQDAMSAFEAAVAAAGGRTRPRDTTAQRPGDTAAQRPGEVWDEATDEPAVRTRPPANGNAARPAMNRPVSAAWPKQPAAWPQQPSAESKQPPAEARPSSAEAGPSSAEGRASSAEGRASTAEGKQPSAGSPAEGKQPSAGSPADVKQSPSGAKKPPGGVKKPAAGAKKPAARSSDSAAADRTSPDKPAAAKPDDPTG